MTKYYRVSQFTKQPTTIDDIIWMLKQEITEEVSEDFNPYWGGAVYSVDDKNVVKLYKDNTDSSD